MKLEKSAAGHFSALITVIVWGTTFISTKVLLNDFLPVEILFFRFVLGFLALFIAYPHRVKSPGPAYELLLAGAGLCGVTLYFLLENIALTYSLASNVGIILSVAPAFTAIFAHIFLGGDEKLTPRFFIGFAAAIAGIALISFNGSFVLRLNPKGDLLSLLAAMTWGIYSILTKKLSAYGYNTIQVTRRIFLYGLIFTLPALYFFDFKFGFVRFLSPVYLLNLLYLGLGASALCFVSWNFAVGRLGAVKTSVYIYISPIVTVITSVIILKEPLTPLAVCGIIVTLAGLVFSEKWPIFRSRPAREYKKYKNCRKKACKD